MQTCQVRTEPWLTEGAIRFLESFVRPGAEILEFGTGASTVWFARHGCHIVSYESDPNWQRIALNILDSQQRLSTILLEWEDNIPERLASICELESFDLVLVDGQSRQQCILASIPLVRPGGVLMIDNADWFACEPITQEFHRRMPDWNYTVSAQRRPDKFGFTYGGWSTAWWQRPPREQPAGEFLTGEY